jgi:hypothetical protein
MEAHQARPDLEQIPSSAVLAIECVSEDLPLVAGTVSRRTSGTSRSSTAGVRRPPTREATAREWG